MKEKKVFYSIIGIVATIVLLILNLIWKFSLGVPFSAMNSGRQTNVIASVILLVIMTGLLIRINVKKKK
ncbi:MAG: hypothetical protein J5517_09605 [Eubacterium sp.]|nr:hypothetical protein [Eubacterium sp.]